MALLDPLQWVSEMSLKDFETKKSVHINLTKSTHSDLRIVLFKRGLSMQEVFDTLAAQICENNPDLIRILDQIEDAKRARQIKRVSQADSDSIFRVIEEGNPFDGSV